MSEVENTSTPVKVHEHAPFLTIGLSQSDNYPFTPEGEQTLAPQDLRNKNCCHDCYHHPVRWACAVLVFIVILVVLPVAIPPLVKRLPTSSSAQQPTKPTRLPLLLISMDGFRADYIHAADEEAFDQGVPLPFRPLPNLRTLLASGAHVSGGLLNSFVTKTFPDHTSLITGMHEDVHGMVANNMYDPVFNETFASGNIEPRWWNASAFFWTYVQRFNLTSAAMFWPGSDVEGQYPNEWFPYDESVSFADRVDTVLAWLSRPQEIKPNFVVLYFHEPDSSGHKYGPTSQEVSHVLAEVDEQIGRLVAGLKSLGYGESDSHDYRGPARMNLSGINIILTSDHGMSTISPERIIVLSELLPGLNSRYFLSDVNPVAGVWPLQNQQNTTEGNRTNTSTLLENLLEEAKSSLQYQQGLFTAYLKDEIPPQLHYSAHRRIPPLILVAKEGWSFALHRSQATKVCCGTHGFSNNLSAMHPFFLGHGPAFRDDGFGLSPSPPSFLPPMASVDVFPLLCHLLDLPIPAGLNGSLAPALPLLRPAPATDQNTSGQ